MNSLQAIFLGILQGLSEFLPISSSGHLVLAQKIFGIKESMLSFDVAVHGGTLLAVLIYFRKEIWKILHEWWKSFLGKCFKRKKEEGNHFGKLLPHIVLSIIPTIIIFLIFKEFFKSFFGRIDFLGAAWFLMGILLILSNRFKNGKRDLFSLRYLDTFLIGAAQGIAILPGISRSGVTIVLAMLLGFSRNDAAKFSFFIAIPAILGALCLEFWEGFSFFHSYPREILIGFLSSAFTGYWVIKWLMSLIAKGKFSFFGYYCLFMSAFTFFVIYFQT